MTTGDIDHYTSWQLPQRNEIFDIIKNHGYTPEVVTHEVTGGKNTAYYILMKVSLPTSVLEIKIEDTVTVSAHTSENVTYSKEYEYTADAINEFIIPFVKENVEISKQVEKLYSHLSKQGIKKTTRVRQDT